jgi:hypothetical protein
MLTIDPKAIECAFMQAEAEKLRVLQATEFRLLVYYAWDEVFTSYSVTT